MTTDKQPAFPKYLHLVPFLPLILCLLGLLFTNNETLYIYLPSGLALIAVAVVYIKQLRFLRSMGKKLKSQSILVAGALVIPYLAVLISDIYGKVHFGAHANNGGLPLMSVLAAIFGLLILNACAIANIYLISPLFKTSSAGKRALRILGIICQVALWVVVAVGAYFGAAITYSLRDPSTE